MRKSGIIPQYHFAQNARPRTPDFNLKELGRLTRESWVLQQIYRAIIQEVMRVGWEIAPRFERKCSVCGAEYQYAETKCKSCKSTKLREPKYKEFVRASKLLTLPNSQRQTFSKILDSMLYDDLVYDDWYMSIEYALMRDRLVPKEVRIQNPVYISPVVDEYGNYTSNEWFCPICFNTGRDTKLYKGERQCQTCGSTTQQTAYEQEVDSEVTARWSLKTMVNGSTYRVLPSVHGEPRGRSLWNIMNTLGLMDEWFIDLFQEGRVQKIVNFPGHDQAKLTELLRRIQSESDKLQVINKGTGGNRTKKSLRTVFLASDTPIATHDVGINPRDMQILEYYKLAIQACSGVYGVQAVFISFMEGGKTGTTPAMQIEVQNRTTREIQRDKEDVISNQMFPIFNIKDWVFKFGDLEKKDAKRDAEVQSILADVIAKMHGAGYETWFDDFGELKWSDKPVVPVEEQHKPIINTPGIKPRGEKESGASGQPINDTTTERGVHGPRESTPNNKGIEEP